MSGLTVGKVPSSSVGPATTHVPVPILIAVYDSTLKLVSVTNTVAKTHISVCSPHGGGGGAGRNIGPYADSFPLSDHFQGGWVGWGGRAARKGGGRLQTLTYMA